MSILLGHIRTARAYQQAWAEAGDRFTRHGRSTDAIKCQTRADIHGRAAEILEAEQLAQYLAPGAPPPDET